MTELRKAAEMALKRLDMYFVEHGNDNDFEATQALRQALAQPEQEPVAWDISGCLYRKKLQPMTHEQERTWIYTPLYTAPPSIEAAVLAEREACARVCLEEAPSLDGQLCAEAIRARGRND